MEVDDNQELVLLSGSPQVYCILGCKQFDLGNCGLVDFEDVLQEVGLMLSDIGQQSDVVQVGNADDIEAAKQQGMCRFLPTLEHLAVGKELNRLEHGCAAGGAHL